MSDTPDPTVTLEDKLTAFAAGLTPDEQIVLHDVVALAGGAADVEGFSMSFGRVGLTGDPDEGGELTGFSSDPDEGGDVTFANTFVMLGHLHQLLPRPRR